MKIGIMQPYFFPYIGYFQCIDAVDKYILYHNISFMKDSWVNRNQILLKHGKRSIINVPLIKKSSNRKISKTRIDNDKSWKRKLLNKVFLNYKVAPHFEEVYPVIEETINNDFRYMHEINIASIRASIDFLDIETEIETDNSVYSEIEYFIKKQKSSIIAYQGKNLERKVVRVLEICKVEKSNQFINAIGGVSLYDKTLFSEFGISLSFIQTDKEIRYNQGQEDFYPNLSIIDVLMFNGKRGTKEMLKKYKLV